MPSRYPFTLVSGQGLGVSYSSLNQVGSVLPATEWGQAQLKLFVNVATGNLIIHDHAFKAIEGNGILDLGFKYNGYVDDPAKAWRFGPAKKFKSLPISSDANTATLIESDGHETVYTSTGGTPPLFVAPGLRDGTPHLYYDNTLKVWVWYDPGTKITEHYNAKGLLTHRFDAEGHCSYFEYDAHDEISAVTGPDGNRYEIERTATDVKIYAVKGETIRVLLQAHRFDSYGRLETTQIPNPDGTHYTVKYTYRLNTSQIREITQSDQTSVVFGYASATENSPPTTCQPLFDLRFGNSQDKFYTVDIDYDTLPARQVSVKAGTACYQFKLDAPEQNSRLLQVNEARGYSEETKAEQETKTPTAEDKNLSPRSKPDFIDAEGWDITTFDYVPTGQLGTISHPDSSQEHFVFRNKYGLKSRVLKPNDQFVDYSYDAGDPVEEIKAGETKGDQKHTPRTQQDPPLPKIPAKPNLI